MTRYMEDDFEGEDRVVVKTPEGAAVVLPVSARRLTGEALELYADMMRMGIELAALEQKLEEVAVPAARELGVSWSLIGAAVGLTGEGARQRYGGAVEGL